MNPLRSRRAWLPAAVAAVSMLLGLIALQVVSHFALHDANAPGSYDSPAWEWLGKSYVGFFGEAAFNPRFHRIFLGTVVIVVVLLVVAFLGSWWAVRGMAPGSSALPAFLSIWMVLVLATTLADVAGFVVRQSDQLGKYPMGQVLLNVTTSGVIFGAKWGWIAALLAVLVWLVARPKPAPFAPVDPQLSHQASAAYDGPPDQTGDQFGDQHQDASTTPAPPG